MNRLTLLMLPLALAACVRHPVSLPPPPEPAARPANNPGAVPIGEARAVVQQDVLGGRWTITAVNGENVKGMWLELGAEGAPVVERRPDGGFNIGRPGPQTGAFFGCNSFFRNGWTRNGDKLTLGLGGSTERGCDEPVMRIEEQGGRILRLPMTMELTPPDRLRLINEAGTLDLVGQRS